ncbi:MAG TPA: DUF4173 domain-containing protein [Anaerolineae bacterium]|nr:DUF4173 domain-containing protein [Anaerolineae bacterium]
MPLTTKLPFSLFLTALILGVAGDLLLRSTPWGINVVLWVLALSFSLAVITHWNNLKLTGGGRWLIGPALIFAALFALRDSIMLNFANLVAVLICLALIASRALHGRLQVATLTDYVKGVGLAGTFALFGALALIFDDIKWGQIKLGGQSKHVTAIGTGLLIAVPVLLIFGALLASADAVFQKMINDLFNWDVYEIFAHVFWIGFWAWVVAGFLRLMFLWKEQATQPKPYPGVLGVVEIGIVLGSLIALFFGFVVVQARYLFGGPEILRSVIKLSYAEYARRGFFELVTVAALVLPFLLFMHWLMKKDNPLHVRLFRLLSGGVIALLFVIMFSALYRMRLYQLEFGLTELRLYTTAFMGWLAIVLVWFMITIGRDTLRADRFAFGALVSAFAVLLILNILNPDDLIVRTNAGRVEAVNPFDASYVVGLSADAVPALIAVLPTMNERDQCVTAARILARWMPPEWGAPPKNFDVLTWNLDRILAWQAVSANWSYLQSVACPQRDSRMD